MKNRYDAVLFDLLTALLDSWSLWNSVAGDAETGLRWRAEYLKISYRTGPYRPYEELVAEAAEAQGLPRELSARLAERYAELRPWSDVVPTLLALKKTGLKLGVVTNCSEALGQIAAGKAGVELDVIVTVERAGFYKPDPRPYQLALDELGVTADLCLFVAGSSYDLFGTAKLGLDTYWHDRIGMAAPPDVPAALAHESTLAGLLALAIG